MDKLYRIVLLIVLAYEAAGCLSGGVLLMISPDGSAMKMPTAIMHGVFTNFLIPGIILFLLGILSTAAFLAALKRTRRYRILILFALGGLLGWFWIEIAILQQLHWLHLMWGGPVVLACAAALLQYRGREEFKRKALLFCGIAASLLYVVVNIVAASQWNSYEPISQTVSELSAIGAPTRFIWNTLCTPYTLLMIAFAWGVLLSAGKSRRLKIVGSLLMVYALLGLLWPFAPMHQREVLAAGGGTASDQLHLALGGVTEVLYLLALLFAAFALGKRFRVYSLITFIVLVVCGILTFWQAPGVAANRPTPLMGVWERINIGIFLLWVIVLALTLRGKKPYTFLVTESRRDGARA